MVQMPPAPRKELNPVRLKENEEGGGGGPTTTVFVGNISEKASDMLVRQLLAVSTEQGMETGDLTFCLCFICDLVPLEAFSCHCSSAWFLVSRPGYCKALCDNSLCKKGFYKVGLSTIPVLRYDNTRFSMAKKNKQ